MAHCMPITWRALRTSASYLAIPAPDLPIADYETRVAPTMTTPSSPSFITMRPSGAEPRCGKDSVLRSAACERRFHAPIDPECSTVSKHTLRSSLRARIRDRFEVVDQARRESRTWDNALPSHDRSLSREAALPVYSPQGGSLRDRLRDSRNVNFSPVGATNSPPWMRTGSTLKFPLSQTWTSAKACCHLEGRPWRYGRL